MKFDLSSARESYGATVEEFAKDAGLNEQIYEVFENSGVIPSQFLYSLWKKYPGIELPSDFFFYTSYTLALNVNVHKTNKKEVCKLFGISEHTLDSYMCQSLKPMYEMKSHFITAFFPLVMPCVVSESDEVIGSIDNYRCNTDKKKQFCSQFKVIQGYLHYADNANRVGARLNGFPKL